MTDKTSKTIVQYNAAGTMHYIMSTSDTEYQDNGCTLDP